MAITEWNGLCRQSLILRTTPNDFVKIVQGKQPLDGKTVLKSLLECRQSLYPPSDPLPPRYLEAIVTSHIASLSDLLVVLISRWNTLCRTDPPHAPSYADTATLQELAVLIISSRLVLDHTQIQKCLLLAARWLSALVKAVGQDNNSPASNFVEPLGSFLATLCATNSGIEILSEKEDDKISRVADAVRQGVEATLGLFPSVSGQLMERLGEVQKHIAMFGDGASSDMQALQFQAGVSELQMAASRAGTVALLQSLLYTARTVDDTVVFNFLAGRHDNDFASMFLDLVFASFLVLKQSKNHGLQQSDHYIRNKLPAILSQISTSSFESFSAEQALIDAWPQLELGTDLLACGQKFVHVCSLHHLLTDEASSNLINDEDLVGSLTKSLLLKDELVSQLTGSPSRAGKLVDEMMNADGNGPSISQALVEVMVAYAHSKETHHLKDLANILLRKPDAINTMALYLRPSYWIAPLCTLLDEWRWDEIHGESQPLYDEFGSILLLILTTKRRLDLTSSELGVKGFVARYLDQEGVEKTVAELSEPSQRHLGDWINALYIAEGLSDDLTTDCSPHDFYTLVPTLIRQSVLAQQTGKLSSEALKGGLEYLLEPFLLPSLVSAMTWAQEHVSIGKALMPIFTKQTGNEIHQTILAMLQSPSNFTFEKLEKTDLQALQQKISAAVTNPATTVSLRYALQVFGAEAVLKCILDVLLQYSGTEDFHFALDLAATLVCVADLRDAVRLKHAELGQLLKKRDTLTAEATVHLYRRVEAYSSVFVVQETNMDIISLPHIDPSDANQEGNQNQEQQMDDIDQVLNESAAMNAMDSGLEGAMDDGMGQGDNMDSFYLQDDNMGLGNLDDLDLDMF
ncbi:uncharacterized protein HMPREF1541_07064 [Cyphellophora europaea CBS 101466]|uniref:Mediator of RNA polymerase II transcription subunit 5 n=1 Tax=Cyphellophora europaea (strain CBS 101466) TaxID=1220924 RepID=W2RRD9_CYPE1|nr:uncharacterized protein HMPREF1541_07064 [Cyphellophora europaea CBS 101466]ETN39022.1 hypothetical protein HMPREF1541_07064 [Cyphellophora europaea CBS 101466]